VSGFDVNAKVAKKAKAERIATLGSAADVAQKAEVVMIMVATGEQVEEVITGSLLGKLAPGSVICALEMAQDAKIPMPLGGLVDQLVKSINQEKMKALLS
jgi:hypothetical protein